MKNFLAGFLIGECLPMNKVVKPLLTFGFRFYVAYVFFKSGLTKVDSNFQVTSSTIDLFKYDFLPKETLSKISDSLGNAAESIAEVSAYVATYAELILPVLLVIGLFSRPAALALFILNAVAAFALANTDFASAAGHWQHIVWGAMLAVIFAFGPGKVSIDKWISNKLYGREANLLMTIISIAVLSAIGYFFANKFL